MPKVLTHEEVIDALSRLDHPQAEQLFAMHMATAALAAGLLAATIGATAGEVEFECCMGCTSTTFSPATPESAWPEVLDDICDEMPYQPEGEPLLAAPAPNTIQ